MWMVVGDGVADEFPAGRVDRWTERRFVVSRATYVRAARGVTLYFFLYLYLWFDSVRVLLQRLL
ncbi:hypothetical protein AWN90_41220 [Nocardia terpenica]|uniref:Uncharacterized protein n=1 Tax=Nocardia terpenica TaxID=455432 RepID=A0A161XCJ7_9NOCA|nr:hypothetical protein AWN90_41220 [Nocardia terpenica]